MIKRTCSNPDCQKDLPLNETYFRRRANGEYRTDCRKCEAKGRADRRKRDKSKGPTIEVPAGFMTTQEVLNHIDKAKSSEPHTCRCHEKRAVKSIDLTVDLADPDSIVNAINSIFGTIMEVVSTIKDETAPAEKATHTEICGDPVNDYLTHGNVVYQAEDDYSACSGCAFFDIDTGACGLLRDGKSSFCMSHNRKDHRNIIWKRTSISTVALELARIGFTARDV